MKKVLRRCAYCRKVNYKENFLRIVKLKDGKVLVDNEFKYFGRSIYICKNLNCIKGTFLRKKLEKGLRINNIPQDIKENLKKKLIESIEEVINEKI